jgi:hypothetical protein
MSVEKQKNVIFRIFYYYFFFIINVLELIYCIFLYIFEHPGLIKPVAGFFTLFVTNIFLFYDFLSPLINYVLDFLLTFEIFSDFYYWVLNNVNQVLGIVWRSFSFLKNVLLSLYLLLSDVCYVTLFLIKNTWKLIVFFISKSFDSFNMIICWVPELINSILHQAFSVILIFLSFFLKSFGIFCFSILLIYLFLFLVDFLEIVQKKKYFLKLIHLITYVIYFLCRCFKGAVLIILNILYFIHFYDFSPESKSFNNTVEAGNQETKLEIRKRTVSFNDKITIIPIDSNELNSEINNLDENMDDVRIKKNSLNEYFKNNQSKNYIPVETFPTLQHGIQRLKDNPLGNQLYTRK